MIIVLIPALFAGGLLAGPLGTAITYQGQLRDGSAAANGRYDLRFTLYDAATSGSVMAGPLTNAAVAVTNGLFTATPDFGGGAFNGSALWLDLAVRTNGSATFVTLSPRQAIAPTPYALAASNLVGTLPASQLTGALPSGQLSGSYAGPVILSNTANSFNGSFSGNGTGLTNVNAASLGGLGASNYWKTAGNAGTAATNFLGTTDDHPLELKANSLRALRLEANSNGAPNVIGGSPYNVVDAGVVGAFIGGGGATNYQGYAYTNRVTGTFGTIVGGLQNTIQTNAAFSFIGAGTGNTVQTNAYYSFIGGGYSNTIRSNATYSLVLGGGQNTIQPNTYYSIIGGGYCNTNGSGYSMIPGGAYNYAAGFYSFAAGLSAKALHQGAFVWADATLQDFASTADNQFNVRAGGGARWLTGGAGMTLDGQPVLTSLYTNSVALNNPANSFGGDGSKITGLNATNLASGTVADARLSTNVARLNAAFQVFTGTNSFANGSGPLGRAGNIHIGAYAIGGDPKVINFGDMQANGLGYVYLGENGEDDCLELRAGKFYFNNGAVGIGKTNPVALLDVNGAVAATSLTVNGAASATSLSVSGSVNTFGNLGSYGNVFMNDNDVQLRNDALHGLGWYGSSKLFAGLNVNGPALYGNSGGVLGVKNGSATNAVLAWNSSGNVTVDPMNLNAGAPLPGLTFGSGSGEGIASQRSTGANQYGLDFYTGFQRRMTITSGGSIAIPGNLGIGGASQGDRLDVQGTLRLNENDVYFRGGGDQANGMGYYSPTKLFTGEALREDGPYIYGYSGGCLCTTHNGNQWVLGWYEDGNVVVKGSLVDSCDRNLKTDFGHVDPAEVLDKVAAMPLQTWRYKAETNTVRHLGPFAQDFYAAFGLGMDDKHIATVDADGVALAAIQGLNQKFEEEKESLRSAIQNRDAEIERLQQRLERLEKALGPRQHE